MTAIDIHSVESTGPFHWPCASYGAGHTVHKEEAMADYNEQTLMEAVIKRVAATPDPRLRQIMTSLVKHLHGCVREVRPTWEELLAGIQFLTAVGQKCDDKRQEFILLSDSLGVSMLVDLLNHGKVGNATESDLLGPAFVEGAPELPLGSNLATHPSDGEPCVITGSVASLDGTPLAGAVVDFWEADGDGFYDLQKPNGANLRARLRTDASGQFWFRAVRPVNYGIPTDGPVGAMLEATKRHNMRAAHLHFMISAPGHERLVTQLFLTGDQYLDSDAVFGVKESLVVDCERVETREEAAKYQVEAPFYRMHYDFVLKPAQAEIDLDREGLESRVRAGVV